MKEKLTKIILPFIFISTGLLLTYSFFYWLVIIRLKLFDFNDSTLGFLFPIIISSALVWFYFRKKLQLLDTTDKHREFTLIMSWILLTAPLFTFQFYLDRETGEITHLTSVNEILTNKPTMYYSIENSSQHKNRSGLFVAKGYPNRGNEIGIGCYYACPLTNEGDSFYDKNIWIGTMFGHKFSNRVFDDKEEQAKLISKFIDSSAVLYDKYEYKTTFLKRLTNSEERNDYLKAIKQSNLPFNKTNLIILREEAGDYQLRAGTSLWWTIFFIITSNIVWTILTIFTKMKIKGKKNP
jgi:hypothetical protein